LGGARVFGTEHRRRRAGETIAGGGHGGVRGAGHALPAGPFHSGGPDTWDREDARDATQNIKVYQKLNTYDPQYRFFSWVYRILRNECLNARRRQATEALTGERAHDADPRVALERAQRDRDVRAALLALPEAYREVIVLRHFAGFSYDEMGVAIGLPAYLQRSIGPTGLLALKPLQVTGYRDRWHRHLLRA